MKFGPQLVARTTWKPSTLIFLSCSLRLFSSHAVELTSRLSGLSYAKSEIDMMFSGHHNNNNRTRTPYLYRHKHKVKGQNLLTNKRNNVTKYKRSHL